MTKEIVYTEHAPAPVGPYSQAIKANGFLYVSGQIAINPKTNELVLGSFEEQSRLVLDNLKAILEAGNSSLEKVIKVTIFLKDMGQFGTFNTIYSEYFAAFKPARACVEVSRLPKDVEVEVEAIALCD